MGPTLFVPEAIGKEGKRLIAKGDGTSVRQGVELLLKNDLKDVNVDGNGTGTVDAGADLQKGLTQLANSPFDALGVDVMAQTMDVRKAYKKMALKYHPDKNPNTTPLFQAIQCASEKLSDRGVRRQEANRYKPTMPPMHSPSNKKPPNGNNPFNTNNNTRQNNPGSNYDRSNQYQQQRQHQQQKNEEEKQRRHKEKQEAWKKKCADEREEAARKKKEQQEQEEAARQQRARGYQHHQKQGFDNFDNWDSPNAGKKDSRRGQQGGAYAQHNRKYGQNYTFENAQREAKEREDERRRKEDHRRQQSDRTFRREGAQREAEAAKARMEARRGKSKAQSEASAREYMQSYAKNKQKEEAERLKEARRRQEESRQRTKPKRYAIPKPSGLCSKMVETTAVQLEWSKVSYSLATLHTELAYRGRALLSSGAMPDLSTTAWETASVLISGDKVKKKNLHLQHCYEFRIRYVVPSPSGKKTQDCGEWSNIVRNILIDPKAQREKERREKREQKEKREKAAYSKYYDPDDYDPYNHQDQNPYKHPARKQSKQESHSQHRHSRDPYAFQDDYEDEEEDETFMYKKGAGYQYKHHHQPNQAKKKKNPLDFADDDQEVEEDPELENILSQSARMAWKWGGGKGKAGIPEREEDVYKRRMSRHSPPPEEVDEDGNKHNPNNQPSADRYDDDDFEDEEEKIDEETGNKWYILNPPSSHCSGFYIHTVYVTNDRKFRNNTILTAAKRQKMMSVLGFISSENYVLVNPEASKDPHAVREDEWLYCQVHWRKLSPSDRAKAKKHGDEEQLWGWVKRYHNTRADKHIFLEAATLEDEDDDNADEVEDEDDEDYDSFNPDFGFHQHHHQRADPNVDTWYEQTDDKGNMYYYNNKTGESKWESPEWVEETDIASGARYFVKLNKDDASPLNSTWSNPGQFARLVRQAMNN